MRNLHQLFVLDLCTASQIIGGDFAKFCGLLRIYELYSKHCFCFKQGTFSFSFLGHDAYIGAKSLLKSISNFCTISMVNSFNKVITALKLSTKVLKVWIIDIS